MKNLIILSVVLLGFLCIIAVGQEQDTTPAQKQVRQRKRPGSQQDRPLQGPQRRPYPRRPSQGRPFRRRPVYYDDDYDDDDYEYDDEPPRRRRPRPPIRNRTPGAPLRDRDRENPPRDRDPPPPYRERERDRDRDRAPPSRDRDRDPDRDGPPPKRERDPEQERKWDREREEEEAIRATSLCPEPTGYFPDATQCDKYYECTNWKMVTRLCPDGLVFVEGQPKIQKCDYFHAVDCSERPALQEPQPNLLCPRKNGYFPHDDCAKFIQCADGSSTTHGCPTGLAFSPKTGTCDYTDPSKRIGCKFPSLTSTYYNKPEWLNPKNLTEAELYDEQEGITTKRPRWTPKRTTTTTAEPPPELIPMDDEVEEDEDPK